MGRARADAGDVARALRCCRPACWRSTGPRPTGSTARQACSPLSCSSRELAAHGRVVWGLGARIAPPEAAASAAAAAPARNAAGFLDRAGDARLEAPTRSLRLPPPWPDGFPAGSRTWRVLPAQALAGCNPARAIELYEAEGRALDAARVNVPTPAGFTGGRPRPAPEGLADVVISNPPFHQGRAAEPELGAASSPPRIAKPRGRSWWRTPFHAALDAAFASLGKIAEDGRSRCSAPTPRRA